MAVYDDQKGSGGNSVEHNEPSSAPVSGKDLNNLEASKFESPEGGQTADDQLYAASDKFANGEELNGEEAAAVKDNLDLERPEPSMADDINDKLNKGYTGDGSKKTGLSNMFNSKSNLKKRMAIAGAAAGGSALFGVLVFIALLPLKIEHIVQNLENKFTGTAQNAVEKETQNAFSSYMKNYVLASLHKPGCTSTASSKDCVDLSSCQVGNQFCKLYQGWHQARLEHNLAVNYGIEFGNSHGRIYMKAPGLVGSRGLPANSIDITSFSDPANKTNIFDLPAVSRTEARQSLRAALNDATLWQKVMFHFRYGKFIETKYGLKRCIIACNIKDSFSDTLANKKQAFAIATIERVIDPRSAALGDALKCFMDPNCKPEDRSGDGTPTEGDPTNGEINSVAESEVQNELDNAAASFGQKTLDNLAGEVDKLNQAGSIGQYVLESALEKVGVSEVTKEAAAKAFPIIGWINTAAEMAGDLGGLQAKIRDFQYAIKAASYAQYFEEFNTVASEMNSGHMDATELGSFNQALSANGVDATQSPLYSKLFDGGLSTNKPTTSKCSNGQPLASGTPFCPEYSLSSTSTVGAALENASSVVPGPVKTIAGLWNSTIGQVLGLASGVTCSIPLISSVCSTFGSAIGGAFKPILMWVVNSLFPTVISTIMPGDQAFVPLAGGADVSGNDYTHHSLGGQMLTPVQVAANLNEQTAEQSADFKSQPLFARLFSTTDQYSLTSQLAMAMPSSFSSIATSGVFSNPLSTFSSVASRLFSGAKAFADSTPQTDDFAVTQYGYPTNDPVFSTDPVTEWDTLHCGDTSANGPTATWNRLATSNINADTGQAENNTNNPCLLLEATIESAGGLSDPSLIPPDNATATTTPTTGSSGPTSQSAPSYCSSGATTQGQKIVCSAYLFDDYDYSTPGLRPVGTALQQFVADVRTCVTGNFGVGCKYPKFTPLVDCSGLVDAAVFDATGVDLGGAATGAYPGLPHLQEININQAQPGDIGWWNTSDGGHTEIFLSYDSSSGVAQMFGAHTSGIANPDQINADSYPAGPSWPVPEKVFRVVP